MQTSNYFTSYNFQGYQIPKGWTIAYGIRDTHETADWPHVDQFNPDRWEELTNTSNRYDFLPFGSGSRACVGKEFAKLFLKVFTIELIRNASWKKLKPETEISYLPVPHPKDNLPLQFSQIPAFRKRVHTA